MLNWEWAVEPLSRNKNAMLNEVIYRITLLCEWYWWYSAVHKKVFPVPAGLCIKKWACSGLIFTVWMMISKADCCFMLSYESCSVNIAACLF